MADPLTIVGGIASFAQLLSLVVKTTEVVFTFCHSVRDAPKELKRIHEKLTCLNLALKNIEAQLTEVYEFEILPPDLCYVLHNSIDSVRKEVITLYSKFDIALDSESPSNPLRVRLKWALLERHLVSDTVDRLRDSEGTLTCALQLLNVRLSLIIYSSQKSSNRTGIENSFRRDTISRPRLSRGQLQNTVLDVDSWLRKFGFFGSISQIIEPGNGQWESRICMGFKPPNWIYTKSITFDLRFANTGIPGKGLSILPGQIRLQNQVSLNSPLMMACAQGDVRLIRQCLNDGSGQVGDRASCCGKTPLLIALEGKHLNAVTYLLESGADPNIGDDNQILPVFALMGMSSDKTRVFPQLPPRWDVWIQVLRLLVKHGASIHEVVREKTLSMLNINHASGDEQILDFFRILLSEGYTYWETADRFGWSAALTALRTRGHALHALEFLTKNGVDMSRIMNDGKSPLHVSAEVVDDVKALEYLWNIGCSADINKQDKWGWTPLHYSVACAFIRPGPNSMQKIRFLLRKGADISLKGRRQGLFWGDRMPSDDFTPGELCQVIDLSLYSKLLEEVKAIGKARQA